MSERTDRMARAREGLLPRWAQDRITLYRRQLAEAEKALSELRESPYHEGRANVGVGTSTRGGANEPRFENHFAPDTHVCFQFSGRWTDAIEVYMATDGAGVRGLEIRGLDAITLQPSAGNSVFVKLEKR